MVSRAEPATQRLFVALWPSREAVGHLADSLAECRPPDSILRWQPPERWHLTLAFLGQADPDRARSRLSRLTLPAAGPLRLTGAGTFGPVLWLGVEHGRWLPDLGRAVRRAVHADDNRSRPHLTVARARGPAAPAHARNAAEVLADYRGPEWIPDGLTLVRSRTGPSPRYELIGSWMFPRHQNTGQ